MLFILAEFWGEGVVGKLGMNIISISFYFTNYELIMAVLNNDLSVNILEILVYNLFAFFNNYFQRMNTF